MGLISDMWAHVQQRVSHAALGTSFCERVLSAANLVLNDGNACLSSKTMEMLVILRVSRKFMEYLRKTYPHLSQQQFNETVVASAD
ncbi:hypothetical protein T492DRAFT_876142 [Pavlovales sp. CCMP2436]|nr:hypothetical protein T492DRAFT_876142 [Pavlovales sp. CCMP2436]